MLKKKTLTETIYNNGDPFQIRKAIDACIGAWQKRDDLEVLWETLLIGSEGNDDWSYTREARMAYPLSVEAVYRANN